MYVKTQSGSLEKKKHLNQGLPDKFEEIIFLYTHSNTHVP